MNQLITINPVELVVADEYAAEALNVLNRHNAMRINRISAFGISLLQGYVSASDTEALLSDCANCGVDAYIR